MTCFFKSKIYNFIVSPIFLKSFSFLTSAESTFLSTLIHSCSQELIYIFEYQWMLYFYVVHIYLFTTYFAQWTDFWAGFDRFTNLKLRKTNMYTKYCDFLSFFFFLIFSRQHFKAMLIFSLIFLLRESFILTDLLNLLQWRLSSQFSLH